MILSAAESLVYNGQRVQYALYNGERVWPVITGDWHTLSVTNQAEDVAIGLTATKDGTPVYERPVGSGDFTASIVEDSVVNMAVVNSAYYRPDINSTGISFAQTGTQTGDSSTSRYTALMSGDASVSIPSLHPNDFFASGVFPSASASSMLGSIWIPAEMTYLSGEPTVSALTRIYSSNGQSVMYTAVPTFTPDVTFKTYTASSWLLSTIRVYNNTNNVDMSADSTAYIGNQYSTAHIHSKTTTWRHTAESYASRYIYDFTLSSYIGGYIGNNPYCYFGVRYSSFNSKETLINYPAESGIWQVSGIAP